MLYHSYLYIVYNYIIIVILYISCIYIILHILTCPLCLGEAQFIAPSAPAKGDTGLADCAESVHISENPHGKVKEDGDPH